jgi:molybdate transport system permease protein
MPIMVRSASAALGSVDHQLEEASFCLGKGRIETFFKVTLPLAARGLLAGGVLSYARALGEFGATVMLAGNIPGKTQTMPLAIYEAVASGEDSRARTLALLLTGVSVVVVLLAARFEPRRPG